MTLDREADERRAHCAPAYATWISWLRGENGDPQAQVDASRTRQERAIVL
jgi:hypothetical protein